MFVYRLLSVSNLQLFIIQVLVERVHGQEYDPGYVQILDDPLGNTGLSTGTTAYIITEKNVIEFARVSLNPCTPAIQLVAFKSAINWSSPPSREGQLTHVSSLR